MSAKYSNYINYNSYTPNTTNNNTSNRKKMFSSKNHQQNDKPYHKVLGLNKQ